MHKKVFFLSIFLVLFTWLNLSFARESQIETVTVKGFGESKQEAVQDGLRSALMQIVGTYMSSKTVVKNYDLIEDKILTYSSGFIEGHKVLSTKRDKDLFVSELRVKVKKGKLAKKVKSLNIAKASIDIDTEKITSSIQTTKFNVSNLEELQNTFNEVVVKPILEEKSHSVTFRGLNIYEIQNISVENTNRFNKQITFSLKDIDSGQKRTLLFSSSKKPRTYRNPEIRDAIVDNNFVVEIKYVVSLANDYYQAVRSFLDVAADKKDKGVSLASYKDYKNANYIILSKLSHIAKRGMVTRLYQFKDRKWKKINIMGNMNLEPYMEFSILDEDDLPVKRWRHNFKGGTYAACNSGEDYTLGCAHYNKWIKDISLKSPQYFPRMMEKDYDSYYGQYSRTTYVWGIVKGSSKYPFIYDKNTKPIAFLKNDGIEYTTYILLDKEEVKIIKDIQISIHPNPVKK